MTTRPPSLSRSCRVGNHVGCPGDGCYCRCHVPADLLQVADEPARGRGRPAAAAGPFAERPEDAAHLEQAKACLYALEARAQLALTQSPRRAFELLAEIRDTARCCLGAIDQD